MDYKYMVSTRCFTFNHAPYIEDALKGFAMQQTTFPINTVVVDDASTDGEPDILRCWAIENLELNADGTSERDTDYAHIIEANLKRNPLHTFVILLLRENHYSKKMAKGPYIKEWLDTAKYHAICEGDDYWIHPQKLQIQVDFMENNPEYGMCHTDYSNTWRRPITPIRLEEDDNYWPSILTKGLRIVTATVLIRVSVFNLIPKLFIGKGWRIGDLPMWYEISQVSKIKYIPVVTTVYRILEESASHSANLERLLSYEKSKLDLKRFYAKTYNVDVDDRVWIKQSYELIIRYAARYKQIETARKYYEEAKNSNVVSIKMVIYFCAAKNCIINRILHWFHLI